MFYVNITFLVIFVKIVNLIDVCVENDDSKFPCTYEMEKDDIISLNCFKLVQSFAIYVINGRTKVTECEAINSNVNITDRLYTKTNNNFIGNSQIVISNSTDQLECAKVKQKYRSVDVIFVFNVSENEGIKFTFDHDFKRNMQRLKLRGCHLTELDEKPFKKIENLTKIDLSSNKFEKLPAKLFDKNLRLKEFVLEGNFVTLELPYGFLANLKYLKSVKLNGNQMKKLPDNLFGLSKSIQTIDLSSNLLENLPE